MPRLFVAVWPPGKVLAQVAQLERPALDGLRWTGPDHWHVTLRFLGQVPDIDAVTEGLSAGPALPTARAVLGPATSRFDQRVLHVPVTGLEVLAERVTVATGHLGRPPERRPFTGHVTLARVRKGAKVDLRPLTGAPLAATWTVAEVCVVESRLSPTGAHYEVRRRISLGETREERSTST